MQLIWYMYNECHVCMFADKMLSFASKCGKFSHLKEVKKWDHLLRNNNIIVRATSTSSDQVRVYFCHSFSMESHDIPVM